MEALKETTYRKPSYRKQVERLLRDYPVLKIAVENGESKDLFPSCTPMYEERVSGGHKEYQSTTERYGVRRANKQLQVKRIEKALAILDLDERYLIEERYMKLSPPLDQEIQIRFSWSESTYRRIKRRALRKLAVALNIL
ncbi:ArpU family phage packaging/lysis transcriptional regulator [Paludifilum halophilum]|uniref:Transcriptional regulator n=1 Tax=Paludifilum halophilum TaxID=1642702 RepID=A0A235B2D7_9BACL|nr:ArpU family phage packaging/lysis transcriptional regulator [Paludifilum halophilum]OYD06119.1 hypothetical protein CHM34_18040 [Paludifilum halophilum]